eukprot:Skav213525  [mRNA]  locus=scaffold1184:24922:28376:- [translate_table: standard]
MVEFYSGSDYAPYAVYGWDADLSTSIPAPARQQNSVIIEVDECLVERTSCSGGSSRAAIYFNFTGAHQIAAQRQAFMSTEEKMFGMLLQQAQHLIDICSSEDDEDEDEETRVSELETIESRQPALDKNVISKEEMAKKSEHIFFHSDFGVANDFCDATTFKAFYEAVKPQHGWW